MTGGASRKTLSDLVAEGSISIADRIALSDADLRRWVAVVFVIAFLIVNGVVLMGIWLAFRTDIDLLTAAGSRFAAADRLVTPGLLMTLIGATTVQLGALVVLMGKYLFPSSKA